VSDDQPAPPAPDPQAESAAQGPAAPVETPEPEAEPEVEVGITEPEREVMVESEPAVVPEPAPAPAVTPRPVAVPTLGSAPAPGQVPPAVVAPREEHIPPVVDVTLVSVGDKEVEVRLADGRTGVVPRADFTGPLAVPEEGEPLRAAVLVREDPKGRVTLSAAWARKLDAWSAVEKAVAEGTTLHGTVAKEVKGGFVVDVGVRAFLPRSMVGEVDGPLAGLVGTVVEVAVSEVDRPNDRLVVSRRDVQRREQRKAEKSAWAAISVGQRRRGRVVSVQDYGAKVDLDPLRGLVHRSELTWGRMGHPSDVVSVGDEVEVLVLDISRSKRRIGLSLRQAVPHPFDTVEVGEVRAGTVVRVLDYGAFVRLDGTDAEGLAHVTEISALPGQRADQLVVPGEELRVKVLSVDKERNRMALSVLQAAFEA